MRLKMKQSILSVAIASALMLPVADVYAAFSSSRSSGVSRSSVTSSVRKPSVPSYRSGSSYSRPAPSYQPRTTYSNQNNYNRPYNSGYNAPQQAYKPRSAMGDIGVGVASIAGGILAAEAVMALVQSPSNPGMYTHPQYPGMTFNAQGVPQEAVPQPPATQNTQQSQAAATAPVDAQPSVQQYNQPAYVQPHVVTYNQSPANDSGLFPFLGFVGGLLEIAGVCVILAGVGYGGYRGYKYIMRQKQLNGFTGMHNDIDEKAYSLFKGVNENSDNREWLEKNTTKMPIDVVMCQPSTVLQYEHEVVNVDQEAGEIVASVHYKATLLEQDKSETKVDQVWHFVWSIGGWKLQGVENV